MAKKTTKTKERRAVKRSAPPAAKAAAKAPREKAAAQRTSRGHVAGDAVARQIRVLRHPVGRSAEVRRGRHRRQRHRDPHGALSRSRGGRLGRAARRARLDARKRARARARQRNRHARSHGHPDVVRHDLQDQGRHRAAAALGLRRVRRRAVEDARQDGVRPQGAVGSRLDRQGHRGRRRRASTG